MVKINSFGETIRNLRLSKEMPLRTVAAYLDIDQAILSKIERGQRKPSREQVVKLAEYFKVEKDSLLIQWLSDKVVFEIADEKTALQVLHAAEKKIAYLTFKKTGRNKLINLISKELNNFQSIQKAWIYGSFARGDEGSESDIDIAFKTSEEFSYFDLAEIQFNLENIVKRKVDVGFIDAFKPYIFEHIKPDLKLIYERQPTR